MNAPHPEVRQIDDTDLLALPWADEDAVVAQLAANGLHEGDWPLIKTRAAPWVQSVRQAPPAFWALESLLQAFPLSSQEGLALMRLAEGLLRVPDQETLAQLLSDQLNHADFSHHQSAVATPAHPLMEGLSAKLLHVAAQVMQTDEAGFLQRLSQRTVVSATLRALQLLGQQFVLGQSIEEAIGHAQEQTQRDAQRQNTTTWSFDMLGEGARTWEDADRYLDAYRHALATIGATEWYTPGARHLHHRPGLSIKLSALHPRFEAQRRPQVLQELLPRLMPLVLQAAEQDIVLTIDAEESHRLELQLAVMHQLVEGLQVHTHLQRWDGLGLAIQAYQLRAMEMIGAIVDLAGKHQRRLTIRLVKGAYWDAEIKRAQELGLAGYPVFTRKAHTDLSYLACAKHLLEHTDWIFPQFATHNAASIAAVLHLSEQAQVPMSAFEFQRLHGMGERIYQAARTAEATPPAVRVYAPVGQHRDLLAYLVRRLLENGANASFVHQLADPSVSVDTLLMSPSHMAHQHAEPPSHSIPLPRDLYGEARPNALGLDLSTQAHREWIERARKERTASVGSPALAASTRHAALATMDRLHQAWPAWEATPLNARCQSLLRAAELLEYNLASWVADLVTEAHKTPADAIAEVRETIDYARYYVQQAQLSLHPVLLPGPTGERNEWRARGRGVFVCIAPWNFPLAIFGGQVMAALVAGNTVAAKPADQTPGVGHRFIQLLHECGIPPDAVQCAIGSGAEVGAALIDSPYCAGVAFTGSVATAKRIQRQMAMAEHPIVPLIAETGGLNAMVVDSTALPEQVVDSVVLSAFGSAGQRCSALRLLCVHKAIADNVEHMLAGAMATLSVGDPADWTTDVGPVIDAAAQSRLMTHLSALAKMALDKSTGVRLIAQTPTSMSLSAGMSYVPPTAYAIGEVQQLKAEHFGPILHVVRWGPGTKAPDLTSLMAQINATGYGLTFGLHTRMDQRAADVAHMARAGNVYVNRGMTGAVVGVQPFGGSGWSGTGPKAGGPHYLLRFVTEQVVSVNTAAAGGNAALLTDGSS